MNIRIRPVTWITARLSRSVPFWGQMLPLESIRGAGVAAGDSDTLSRPLEHLLACHRRVEARLDTLERAVAAWSEKPEEAHAAMRQVVRFFETSGAHHTADEEESFFPRLLERLEPGERAVLARIEHEHTEAHHLHQELNGLVASPPGDPQWLSRLRGVVTRLCEHYRAHIAMEDEVFAPLAAAKLTPQDLTAISSEMKARRGHRG